MNWPTGFYSFLDMLCPKNRNQVRTNRVYDDFGSLYTTWLEKEWRHESFDFIQNVFDMYLVDNYGLSRSIRHLDRLLRYPELADKFSYVSVNYASELLGVSVTTILKLINSGQLKTYGDQLGTGSTPIKKTDILELQKNWNFLLNLEEVTQMLHVSEDVVLDMAKLGLFSAEYGPDQGFSQWKFGEIRIQAFVNRVKGRCYPYSTREDNKSDFTAITLSDASRKLSVVGMNAASILQRIANGKLWAYFDTDQIFALGTLLFNPVDISTCANAVRLENNWIGRIGVTRRLKIKDTTLAKLVKTGLLVPIATYGGALHFDRDDVERFISEHVNSEGAAQLLNVGELTIQNWVRQGRLQAISGPGIDDCHVYLFRKEELIEWYHGRLSFGAAAQLLGVSSATLDRWVRDGKATPLDDMGGKQRWFSRQEILRLREGIKTAYHTPTS